MADSIGDLLTFDGAGPDPNRSKEACRHYGLLVGVVANNQDPDKLGRVKVWLPDLSPSESEKFETTWARLALPMGGKERGVYFVPEVDDEVLVAFILGDISQPVVVGCLWNGTDKPPKTDDHCSALAKDNARGGGAVVDFKNPDNSPYKTKDKDFNENGKNELRFVRSRSGHLVMFDDTKDNERLSVIDKTHKHRFSIRSKPKKVVFSNEDGDIELYAPKGTIYLEAKQIQFLTSAATKLESKDTFDVLSKGKMKCETKDTQDVISGAKFTTNSKAALERKASSSVKVESGSAMNVEAGASMTCKATMINLN